MPIEAYALQIIELLAAPLRHLELVWLGIVPLYVSLLLGELYKSKVSYAHAVGNGFVMLWAGLNWATHLARVGAFGYVGTGQERMVTGWIVTACCIGLGIFTVVLGLRKKDKALCSVLGHTRFSSYFLILFYPMQVGLLRWHWPAVAAVLVFALPAWFLLYLLGRLLRTFIK